MTNLLIKYLKTIPATWVLFFLLMSILLSPGFITSVIAAVLMTIVGNNLYLYHIKKTIDIWGNPVERQTIKN